MTAFYNENSPEAAAWLRELIKQGHIAPGIVDERSIEDVKPNELAGFTQCHFFAGIGVWSHALRRAGWPDDRPVWTGSCPCQPFSAAGKGAGFADERHLWPAFHHLIRECRPDTVLGEQVASKDGLGWLDLVSSDMEGSGYAIGEVDTCAAGFGAPHIRQRLYWVADAAGLRQPTGVLGDKAHKECAASIRGEDKGRWGNDDGYGREDGWLGHTNGAGSQPRREGSEAARHGGSADPASSSGGLADTTGNGRRQGKSDFGRCFEGISARQKHRCSDAGEAMRSRPTNGFWANSDWLFCRDGKWRPVESGTFPLAHGPAARVGRLRGYGNAIVAPQAQAFIETVVEWRAA